MKRIFFIILVLLGASDLKGYAQVFSQNFDQSENVADYVKKNSPDKGEFDAAVASKAGTIQIKAGKLILSKNGADGRPFIARTTPLALSSQFFSFSFKLEIRGSKGDASALIDIGGNYSTTSIPDSTNRTFARLVFHMLADGFSIRNPQQGQDGPGKYSGEQQITWIVNRSGMPQTYQAPDGSSQTVNNNRWDLWVGNSLEFDDRGYLNKDQTIDNFKFIVMSSIGEAAIDDMVIKALNP